MSTEVSSTHSPAMPARPSSLEAAVEARRAQLQAEQTIDLPVPSWNQKLIAQYRGVTWKETRKNVVESPDLAVAETTTAANLLIAANVDVYFLEPDGTKLSLGPWPVAAGKLGVDPKFSARQALMVPGAIFQSDIQMMAHFGVLQEWLQGNDERADEVLVGESDAPA